MPTEKDLDENIAAELALFGAATGGHFGSEHGYPRPPIRRGRTFSGKRIGTIGLNKDGDLEINRDTDKKPQE